MENEKQNNKKSICFEVPSLKEAISIITVIIGFIIAIVLYVSRTSDVPYKIDNVNEKVEKYNKDTNKRIDEIAVDVGSMKSSLQSIEKTANLILVNQLKK